LWHKMTFQSPSWTSANKLVKISEKPFYKAEIYRLLLTSNETKRLNTVNIKTHIHAIICFHLM
jgi:hypothetical protein